MNLNINPIVKQLLIVVAKFLLFTVIVTIVGILCMLLVTLIDGRDELLSALSSDLALENIDYQIIYNLGIVAGQMTAAYTIFKLIEKRQDFFKINSASNKLREFMIGSVWGIGIITVVVVILKLSGLIEIESFNWNGTMLIKFFSFFFVAALVEELMFRTFTISLISPVFGQKTALFLSTVLFAWIHQSNPSFDIIPLLNLLLGGLVLGLLYIKYDQIWCPLGFHLTWNFFQGSVYGFEVSGLNSESILTISRSGNSLLTGGDFGLEGSILSVIGLVLVIVFYREDWTNLKDRPKGLIEKEDEIA